MLAGVGPLMGAHYEHISLADRREIFRLREAKLPVRLIAERLGRHRSSIYRELRRNWFRDSRSEFASYATLKHKAGIAPTGATA